MYANNYLDTNRQGMGGSGNRDVEKNENGNIL